MFGRLALALLVALGLIAAAPATADAGRATTTITVDASQAGALPVKEATAAWSKNTNVTLVVKPCVGAGCIMVTQDDAYCAPLQPDGGDPFGPLLAGCMGHESDGTCKVVVETWIDPWRQLAPLEHEIGHCLGLPHKTTDPRSIMQPVINVWDPPRGPDSGDRADVRALYP